MQELSTLSQHIEEIAIGLLSLGLLSFATLAAISKNTASSVIYFLNAALMLSGIAILISNVVIGVLIAIIYTSISGLFLVTSKMSEKRHKIGSNKLYCFLITSLLFLGAIVWHMLSVHYITLHNANHATGLGVLTIEMCVLFIVTVSGISFLHYLSVKKN